MTQKTKLEGTNTVWFKMNKDDIFRIAVLLLSTIAVVACFGVMVNEARKEMTVYEYVSCGPRERIRLDASAGESCYQVLVEGYDSMPYWYNTSCFNYRTTCH